MIYIEIESVISMLMNDLLWKWIIPNKWTRCYYKRNITREMMATFIKLTNQFKAQTCTVLIYLTLNYGYVIKLN